MSDYYWQLTVRPGRKYDSGQPRVPAGDPRGGQWTSTGMGEHPWAERVRKSHGTTENLENAGFILADGDLLDITDKDDPYRGILPGVSKLQHYMVAGEGMGDEGARRGVGSGTLEPLWKFMKHTGMIRLNTSSFNKDVAVSAVAGMIPTSGQRKRILELADDPGLNLTYDTIGPKGSTLGHGQIRNRLDAARWFRELGEVA